MKYLEFFIIILRNLLLSGNIQGIVNHYKPSHVWLRPLNMICIERVVDQMSLHAHLCRVSFSHQFPITSDEFYLVHCVTSQTSLLWYRPPAPDNAYFLQMVLRIRQRTIKRQLRQLITYIVETRLYHILVLNFVSFPILSELQLQLMHV